MKTVSKIIQLAGSIGLIVGLVAVVSVPTYAVTGDGTSSAACTRIATLGDTSSATIAGHIVTMNSDFAARINTIASRETGVDASIATARTTSAESFDTKVAHLSAIAGLTPAQKIAVTTFSDNMHNAETARETAVDAARATYRTGLTAAVNTHQTNLAAATTAYQTAVASAFTTAETNCGDGTATATLKTAITSAKATFKTSRDDANVTTNIKALMTTRNTAIASADADFVTAAAGYTKTLVAALETTTSTTNS